MMPLTLTDPGEEAVIRRVGGNPETKKHLEDLGFTVGSSVTVMNTIGGNHATILLDDQPEVTVAAGSLVVTSKAADSPVKIEIDSIATMKFGDASSTKVSALTAGIICSLQQGTATFKGIPSNTMIKVCTIDGGIVPIPRCTGGELRLTRASLGPGIYIVRIGTFATKITL